MIELSDLNSAREIGHLVGITDRAMARLGVWACGQAAEGLMEHTDAGDILVEFNTARRRASGDPRIIIEPHKVQVSKLARIMMVGEIFGERGVTMLETFCDLHIKKFITMAYGTEITFSGEYNGLVEIAREAVRVNKVLSKKDIERIALVS